MDIIGKSTKEFAEGLKLGKAKPLPDIVSYGLKILFIGYNPGILSGKTGHHYSHKSNRFWKLLSESGLTPYRFEPVEDIRLLELGFGSTNIVDAPTKSANELKAPELKEGSQLLYELIKEIKPRIACYVGIGVYRTFASNILNVSYERVNINTGILPNSIVEGTIDFVCSSTSGLNTIPYTEQLRCFRELKNLL